MNLLTAITSKSAHELNPTITLFGVSATGTYTLLERSSDASEIVEKFKLRANAGEYAGLEVRVNGFRVQFDIT